MLCHWAHREGGESGRGLQSGCHRTGNTHQSETPETDSLNPSISPSNLPVWQQQQQHPVTSAMGYH